MWWPGSRPFIASTGALSQSTCSSRVWLSGSLVPRTPARCVAPKPLRSLLHLQRSGQHLVRPLCPPLGPCGDTGRGLWAAEHCTISPVLPPGLVRDPGASGSESWLTSDSQGWGAAGGLHGGQAPGEKHRLEETMAGKVTNALKTVSAFPT